ncbi:MAG: response regulator [Treponema sp.]|nr:response regulator [Treponema sp.]
MKTIFVVDDNDTNLSLAEEALENQYDVVTMSSAARMFELLEKITPDLILLDIKMPGMDGLEALALLKSDSSKANIPVILLTSLTTASVEAHGFELGAIDFISKPFSTPVLLNRIKTHLDTDELIRERTSQIEQLQSGTVFVLADIVENRDKDTGGHIERVTMYIEILISAMLVRKVYAGEMQDWDMELVISSARLHDVGKILISDAILNKRGPLDKEEYEIIKSHAITGGQIIDQIMERTGEVNFLHNAKLFAAYHHENWDGSGYPYGLKGMDIPLQGRIMAIADVYDALVSERPYKKVFSEEEAVNIIMSDIGKRFDPKIADVFYDVKDQFKSAKAHLSEQVTLPQQGIK